MTIPTPAVLIAVAYLSARGVAPVLLMAYGIMHSKTTAVKRVHGANPLLRELMRGFM